MTESMSDRVGEIRKENEKELWRGDRRVSPDPKITGLLSEIDSIIEQSDNRLQLANDLTENIRELEAANKELKESIVGQSKIIEGLKEENGEQRLEINETEDEISKLMEKDGIKTAGLEQALREKVRTRNNDISTLKAKVGELEAENRGLKEGWPRDEQGQPIVLDELEDRDYKVASIKESMGKKEPIRYTKVAYLIRSITALKAKVKELEAEKRKNDRNYTMEFMSKENKISELEAENNKWSKSTADLLDKIHDLENEKAVLEVKLKKVEEKIYRLSKIGMLTNEEIDAMLEQIRQKPSSG